MSKLNKSRREWLDALSATGSVRIVTDEALVVADLPVGTYVLEYTDEGLIEEGVPASRRACRRAWEADVVSYPTV